MHKWLTMRNLRWNVNKRLKHNENEKRYIARPCMHLYVCAPCVCESSYATIFEIEYKNLYEK